MIETVLDMSKEDILKYFFVRKTYYRSIQDSNQVGSKNSPKQAILYLEHA